MMFDLFREEKDCLYEAICNYKNCGWQESLICKDDKTARLTAIERHATLHAHKPNIKIKKLSK